MESDELIFIFGPTSSGKSKLAIEISLKLDGEIVNFDSMQLYKHMEIGVGAPTQQHKKIVKHHLYNIYPIWKKSTVYEHSTRSLNAIQGILRRGKVPILVGGSYLYARAFLETYFVRHKYKIRMILTQLSISSIKDRVYSLPSLGFIDEVRFLMRKKLMLSPSAKYAIGYMACTRYILGIINYSQFISSMEKETVDFAKIQRRRSLFFKKFASYRSVVR